MNESNKDFININQEIEITCIVNFLSRNFFFIAKFAGVFFLAFYAYSFTINRVWQGMFEILKTPSIGNTSGINLKPKNSIINDIEVFLSEPFLRPIYTKNIIEKKKKDNNYKIKDFLGWRNDIDVKLKQKTNVLRIIYKDDDRENIIPVLNQLADSILNYNKQNQDNNFSKVDDSLNKQIDFYRNKSNSTFKKAQEFAINQNLLIFNERSNDFRNNNEELLLNQSATYNSINNLNIEAERVRASKQLLYLDLQIKKIEENNNLEEISSLISQLKIMKDSGLMKDLNQIEKEYQNLRNNSNGNDKRLNDILEDKKILGELIKKRALGILKSEKNNIELFQKESNISVNKLMKYKELLREAQRDEDTLIKLENLKRNNFIKYSNLGSISEFVTKPYIEKYPIYPSRREFAFLGLFLGILTGLIISFVKDKKNDFVYDDIVFESVFKTKIIQKIDLSEENFDYLFLKDILKSNNIKQIKLITKDLINKEDSLKIRKIIIKNNIEVSEVSALGDLQKDELFILVVKVGYSKLKMINELSRKLFLLNRKPFGLIVLI